MKYQLRFWLALLFSIISTLLLTSAAAYANRAKLLQAPEYPLTATNRQIIEQQAPAQKDPAWTIWPTLPRKVQLKIDPQILAELSGEAIPAYLRSPKTTATATPQPLSQTRFLVYLRDQANLTAQADTVYASQVERRRALFTTLVSTAQAAQAGIKAQLESQVARNEVNGYQSFYIVNALAVEGGLSTVIGLAQRDDVERIVADYPLRAAEQTASSEQSAQNRAAQLDPTNWNITLVGADRVWHELGITGKGAVVAGFDTGVDFTHPALVKHYRGNLGNNQFNHNYNWFEPDSNLYKDGNLGASVSAAPHDCDGHGTHTMGTAVGDGETPGTQIGMAPGATWIALPGICFNTMPGGISDDIGALKAFQWLLCPTDLTGDLSTADCTKAPDVVNNSWGSANPTDDVLRPAIQRLRAAGIAPVFASGNPAAGPGSIGTPANAPEAITVGATDRTDQVAYFSGRGPSFYAGVQKPQLTAPGVDVLSSIPGSDYTTESGTSMAAPHVTGLIALMVAADLQDGVRDFNVDELERFLTYTAVDLGKPGPDDDYGYGRINAYEAVRWVLSAGDLRGKVTDATSQQPIGAAIVQGLSSNARNNFAGPTNSSGAYSLTVPAGTYDVQVQAWGYDSRTFPQQTVFAHANSLANFALQPLPKATLTGFARTNGAPLDHALIYVEQAPQVSTYTNADGGYTLALPVGIHDLVVQTPGQRILHETITIGATGLNHDFALQSAPTILLVDADAQGGWFFGWSTATIFRGALDQQNYQYDFWPIQYSAITDTQTLADGSIGYGLPSLATLSRYNLVIWSHRGCGASCFSGGTPQAIGADQTLEAYLNQGGRLILSGQDIGSASDPTLFTQYLHAEQQLKTAAVQNDTITGSGFLQGLTLTVTNASLYGYANGYIGLSPDGVAPVAGDGAAYPVLSYAGNQSGAALAIDSCAAPYRAVYFAIGFENIGPRAGNRSPAIAETLGRSIAWVLGAKPNVNLVLSAQPDNQRGQPGGRTTYPIRIANTGLLTTTVQVTFSHNQWPVHLLDAAGQAVTQPFSVGPCAAQELLVAVDIPAAAHATAQDSLTVSATARDNPTPVQPLALTTTAFPIWRSAPVLPTIRTNFATVALPDTPYLYNLGGLGLSGPGNNSYQFLSVHERYNTCTQQWETMAPLPQALSQPGVGVLNGKLYVVGGLFYPTAGDLATTAPSPNVYVYDPATNQWSTAASLPQAAAGMAVAAANGKLYAFGVSADHLAGVHTYAYDPGQNQWQEKQAPPYAGAYALAAAALNGKVYLVRTTTTQNYFDVYDPGVDSWTSAAPLNTNSNVAPGLTAAPDNFLYATGILGQVGGASLAKRYDPQTNHWTTISNLNNQYHFGAQTVYATGRIFTVGGQAGNVVEALAIGNSFCLSEKTAAQLTVTPGGRLTYTVNLLPDQVDLPNVQVVDPLPAQTNFVAFGDNRIGVVYNAAQRQLEWQGTLAANSAPLQFSYSVDVAATAQPGEALTSQVRFDSGNPLRFNQTVTNTMVAFDLAPSTKAVDRAQALSGTELTYTINVRGSSAAGGAVTVSDPLPTGLDYVPDSLTFTEGAGHYDAATRQIIWNSVLQGGAHAYLNTSEDYAWGDSDGNGQVPQVQFAWQEIAKTGTALRIGDDVYTCGLPIGFAFPFYGQTQSTFCMSANGLIFFDAKAYPSYINTCPLPSPTTNNYALIAALWDDLIISGSMTYQTFGVAPNRYLVAQWSGARSYATSINKQANFELILYENGLIRLQVLTADGAQGGASTTGLQNIQARRGLTYSCNQVDSLHDQLAVLFVPPGAGTGEVNSNLSFRATSAAALGVNVWLTNTATIATAQNSFLRSAATLINSVDLSASTIQVKQSEVNVGELVVYNIRLQNTGLVAANNASLALPLPAALTYSQNSVLCSSGACQADGNNIQWAGALAPGSTVTIQLAAQLTTVLPDRTPVTTTVQFNDGFGQNYTRAVTFLARRSDLSASLFQILPPAADPGATVSVSLIVRNIGALTTTAEAQITVPAGLLYLQDSLVCGIGTCSAANDSITWQGEIAPRSLVPIRFQVKSPPTAHYGDLFTANAVVKDSQWGGEYPFTATLWLAHSTYLPFMATPGGKYQFYLPLVGK